MAIDPTSIADATNLFPTESALKLGHTAIDHAAEQEAREIQKKAKVNPITFALSHISGAALVGALTLAGFGLTYAAVTGLVAGSAILAIPLTGALWFGGNAFLKAYNTAQQHNESLGHHLKEVAIHGRHHDKMSPSHTPVVAIPSADSVIFGAEQQPEYAAAQTASPEQPPRPAFLNEILAKGSRNQLSPKDLAAKIEAERSSSQQHI